MRLGSKLKKWQEKGFIDETQRGDILSYERAKMSRHFSFGMQLCGGFAVLLGFSLIIAANWHEFGRYAKLGGHFILNAGLSFWLFKVGYNRVKPVLQEMLTLALFGLNLTFIALIGQVFQLDGELHEALLLWMILSAPVMICYARASFTAWLWIISFYVSLNIIFYGFADNWDEYSAFMGAYALALFVPLGLYADHHLEFTRKHRPAFASCFRASSLFVMAVAASLASVMFYDASEDILDATDSVVFHYGYVITITGIAVASICSLRKVFAHNEEDFDWGMLLICTLFIAVPLILPFDSSVLSAAHFILLWILLGAWGQRHHMTGLVNLAIAFVAIRMYIVFLELFGNALMDTGLGLIVAGGVMIGFVSVAKKLRRYILGSANAEKEAS
jgi:uncharacterized membrane protein